MIHIIFTIQIFDNTKLISEEILRLVIYTPCIVKIIWEDDAVCVTHLRFINHNMQQNYNKLYMCLNVKWRLNQVKAALKNFTILCKCYILTRS